jgi:hypothetical protein
MSLYRGYNLDENAFDALDEVSESAMDTYVNLMAYDNITNVDEAQIKEFCEGPVGQALLEKNVLNKGTMMRLSRVDDENRRVKLIVYQLASEAKDKEFAKMKLYRSKWKASRAKLMQKYGRKATVIARKAQQQYIKRARSGAGAESDEK